MQRLLIIFLLLCGFSSVQGMVKSPTGFFEQESSGHCFNECGPVDESSSDDTSYWSHSSRWASSSDDWSDVESFGTSSEDDEDSEISSSRSLCCLLKRVASRTPSPLEEQDPLMQAVRDNDYQKVRLLCLSGANINIQGINGTPLHEAIRLKNNKIVLQLLLFGAHVEDNANPKRKTPLHVAVESNNDYAVEQLFYARVNVRLADSDGRTPGHLVQMGYSSKKIVRLFEVNHGFVE
ncbi:ankyrin repeat domain-containing protein [Candidatus Babeliales bacterium]|nr:ankyrin repeat domain-containing protein [Candidatus Babeliales bacterium]